MAWRIALCTFVHAAASPALPVLWEDCSRQEFSPHVIAGSALLQSTLATKRATSHLLVFAEDSPADSVEVHADHPAGAAPETGNVTAMVRESVNASSPGPVALAICAFKENILGIPQQPCQAVSEGAVLVASYAITMMLIAAFTSVLLWQRGLRVIFEVVTYLISLSTMKLVVAELYEGCKFEFPMFVSSMHFFFCGLVAFGTMFYRHSTNSHVLAVPSMKELMTVVLPVCFFFSTTIVANNYALMFVSVSFSEIVASATPLVSVAMILLEGQPFDLLLIGPVMLVAVGVIMTTAGEIDFSFWGLVLCVYATVARAARNVISADVLTGDMKKKYGPIELLGYMCLPAGVLFLGLSLVSPIEGAAPYRRLLAGKGSILFMLLMSCLNSCCMNFFMLVATKELGAIGIQLVAQTKTVLVVFGGIAVLQEKVSRMELMGLVVILVGVFFYSRMEQHSSKKADRRSQEAALVPAVAG